MKGAWPLRRKFRGVKEGESKFEVLTGDCMKLPVLSGWAEEWWRRVTGWTAPSTGAKGQRAEAAAARYLRRQGYRLLGQNVRRRYGEMDILALHQGWLVVVEVRSRGAGSPPPHATLSRDKRRRLRRLAQNLHREQRFRDLPVRIDLVEVTIDERGRPASFEIYQAAC